MVKPEKGMGGTKDDHPDTQHNNRGRRRGTDRRTLFYKQPAIRDRRNSQGSPWSLAGVESYHWHLDVTFREDGNHTLEKQAAYNLNIIRKLSLNILKVIEVGSKALSMKKKRFAIGTNPEKHLEQIMNL